MGNKHCNAATNRENFSLNIIATTPFLDVWIKHPFNRVYPVPQNFHSEPTSPVCSYVWMGESPNPLSVYTLVVHCAWYPRLTECPDSWVCTKGFPLANVILSTRPKPGSGQDGYVSPGNPSILNVCLTSELWSVEIPTILLYDFLLSDRINFAIYCTKMQCGQDCACVFDISERFLRWSKELLNAAHQSWIWIAYI